MSKYLYNKLPSGYMKSFVLVQEGSYEFREESWLSVTQSGTLGTSTCPSTSLVAVGPDQSIPYSSAS